MIKNIYNNLFKAVRFGWPFVLIVIIFLRCSESEDLDKPKGEIVAEYNGNYISANELEKLFGKDWKTKEEKVNDFLRIWAMDKIVAKEAEKVLADSDKDFRKEIESYKNSLLKYKFEQNILDSVLDLEIGAEDIQKYFQENQKNFELKENIVRVRYVKISKKHKKLNKVKYMIQYKDSSSQEKFFDLIKKENIFCEANDSVWHKLEDLKNLIPFKLYNDEHFLRNYAYTEAPDGDDVWIIYFTENRLKKGVAPLEMVEDQIKAIILNQRKQELIQSTENKLYQKAIKNKELKIYVKNK